MKTINIDFNFKTIDNAIKEIDNIKKKMREDVIVEFLKESCEWVIGRANQYLSIVRAGSNVVADIQSNWQKPQISIDKNLCSATIVNTSNKSVYIEFGVGVVAQQQPHPQANIVGYEYNMLGKKDKYNQWRFRLYAGEEDNIDLNIGYYSSEEQNDKVLITTKGSPANLYLHNALMDYVNGMISQQIWNKSVDKILG